VALYPYQQRVKELLQSGRSVILQAPTGAGKTRAALAPFIEAFFEFSPESFPKQCIYSVPMRVLASQFEKEYRGLAQKHARLYRDETLKVSIQTGERSDDPKFQKGDLIFATIDQTLSSALAVPYSLSSGQANLNAGAFYASYLVFDEFHLFPVDEKNSGGAMLTTLQLLSRLKGLVPFILMTATFSSHMLQELAQLLNAEVVTVDEQEFQMIAGQGGKPPRQRQYHVHDATISADTVLAFHQTRSIVICNQVKWAQALYQAISERAQGETEVVLLHSRFTKEDRQKKETFIQREFGKNLAERQKKSVILVATQVVEVGLDITSEHLHTEIAPANAVLQRAGRCARYPGEEGHVHIYRTPEREHNGKKRPDYLPYPHDLSEKTWNSFQSRDGKTIGFQEEQRIIDEVHQARDAQMLESLKRQSLRLWDDIYDALAGDVGKRSTLIRKIDNITVLAASTPDAVGNPFLAQGFGLRRGTVYGIYRDLQSAAAGEPDFSFDANHSWQMKMLVATERNPDDPTRPIDVLWQEVNDATMLQSASIVVINSRFCAYDDKVGFRVTPHGDGDWASKPGPFHLPNSQGGYRYRLESYPEHVRKMLRVYEQRFRHRLAYISKRLQRLWGVPPGGLDKAIRIAIALHDVAKMDTRWQQWVRLYQQAIGEPIADTDYMAVHTHWDPENPTHKAALKAADQRVKRPPHAGESAVATAAIVGEILAGNEILGRGVFTAIARHHSAHAQHCGAYRLHPASAEAVTTALALAGFHPTLPPHLYVTRPDVRITDLFSERNFRQQVVYLLIARYLRLADGLSQEEE